MRAVVIAATLLAASAAQAGPNPPARATGVDTKAEARKLAARAQVHYDLGEYEAAIGDYRAAYRLHPSPGLLYNLGQAYRLMGDCVSATTMYRSYLRLAPSSPYRNLVKQHLVALDECTRRRSSASGDGIVLAAADGGPVGLGAADVGEHSHDAQPGRGKRIAGGVMLGAGVLLAVAGGWYGLESMEASDEVSELYQRGARWKEIEAADERGQRAERLGLGLGVAGGAVVLTGAVVSYLGWREGKRESHLAVVPTRGGGAVTMGWGF